jgi:hypothetical protein
MRQSVITPSSLRTGATGLQRQIDGWPNHAMLYRLLAQFIKHGGSFDKLTFGHQALRFV